MPRADSIARVPTASEGATPWRLVATFGLSSLLLFLLRRLDLAEAFARASEILDVDVRAIELPWAEAAVDVDKVSDWRLVNEILADAASSSARDAETAGASQTPSSDSSSKPPVVAS